MHYEIGPRPPSPPDALFARATAVDAASKGRRILIIEDDPLNRKLFRDLLRAKGYDVHTAPDGLSGLDRCRKVAPDLVLLDVHLPGLTGVEVAQALSDRDDPPRILAISAFAGQAEARRLRDAGCVGHLPKPVAIDAFLARIDEVLRSAV